MNPVQAFDQIISRAAGNIWPFTYIRRILYNGTPMTYRPDVNFTGAGVVVADTSGRTTVTIAAGGGGGTFKQVTVNFGAGPVEDGNSATVSIADAAVTAATKPVCNPCAVATADHDPDDYVVEGIDAYATNIQNGVGFDVIGTCIDTTWGQYLVDVTY